MECDPFAENKRVGGACVVQGPSLGKIRHDIELGAGPDEAAEDVADEEVGEGLPGNRGVHRNGLAQGHDEGLIVAHSIDGRRSAFGSSPSSSSSSK